MHDDSDIMFWAYAVVMGACFICLGIFLYAAQELLAL
jgi:hypothetical protein